jgi:hypothetical protein
VGTSSAQPVVVDEPHYQSPTNELFISSSLNKSNMQSSPTSVDTSIFARVNIDTFQERRFDNNVEVISRHSCRIDGQVTFLSRILVNWMCHCRACPTKKRIINRRRMRHGHRRCQHEQRTNRQSCCRRSRTRRSIRVSTSIRSVNEHSTRTSR